LRDSIFALLSSETRLYVKGSVNPVNRVRDFGLRFRVSFLRTSDFILPPLKHFDISRVERASPPKLPRIRTSPIQAYGSSGHGFASTAE